MMTFSSRTRRFGAAVASLLVGVSVLSACGFGSAAADQITDDFPQQIAADQVVLFRRASDRLVVFDTTTGQIDFETVKPQLFHYAFADNPSIYTAGDSVNNGFRVLRVDGARVETVLTADRDQGVFPLASDGSTSLFTKIDYAEDGAIVRTRVARLEGSMLVDYENINDRVIAGVIVDGSLFYTAYRPERDDYDLLRVDLADQSSNPELLDVGLAESDVYAFRNTVIANDFFGPTGATLNCDYYCYFDSAHGLLLTMYPNDSQDLSLDAIDLESGRLAWTRSGDLVDFVVDGETLTLYGIGQAPEMIPLVGINQ